MTAKSERDLRDLRDGCRLVSLAARLVQRRQDDVLTPLGLTRASVIALEGIAPGPLNQEQLAAAVHVKSQTLGKILARLQIAGLVSRSRHPRDRRQLVVGLTVAGRAALEAAHRAEARAFPADLDSRGWQALREELARFIDAVQADAIQNQDRARSRSPASHLSLSPAVPRSYRTNE